jgi:hypothetical protein
VVTPGVVVVKIHYHAKVLMVQDTRLYNLLCYRSPDQHESVSGEVGVVIVPWNVRGPRFGWLLV